MTNLKVVVNFSLLALFITNVYANDSLHLNYKLGAEERIRYEYKQDFDLNKSNKDTGSLLFTREKVNALFSLTDSNSLDRYQFFIEGLNAQTGGYRIKAVSNQTDDFDLHQAYLNFLNISNSGIDLKIGRQEMKFGKGRIIGAPSWNNRMRSYDAGIVHFAKHGFYVDSFYGQDIKYDDDKFNHSRTEEFIAGVYTGYQQDKSTPLFETYYIKFADIKGITDIHRYTTGARIQTTLAKGLTADIEVPIQYGKTGTTTSGSKTIQAWAFHADLTQKLDHLFLKPKIMLIYDQASGDKDPNDSQSNTFVPIYQSAHEAYGIMDLVRWQNMRNPEINLSLYPSDKFYLTTNLGYFWLDNTSDSWYGSSGSAIRTKTSGKRSSYLGSEASIRFFYDFNKNLKFETGYAHFSSGQFMRDSGSDDNINWIYSQMILKF